MLNVRRIPVFLFPLVGLALVLGVITGWERVGFSTIDTLPHGHHGALMIGCFLGGLIMTERAVAVGKTWAFTGALLCVISLILLLAGYPLATFYGITLAALCYTLLLIYQQYKSPDRSLLVSILGGFCLLTGNSLLLIKGLYPLSVNWWMGFLLFTILGERLALTRSNQTSGLVPGILVTAVFSSLLIPFHSYGAELFGGSLVILGIYLLYSETFAGQALPYGRYLNIAVAVGYSWLILTGFLMLAGASYYDAQLHTFFVGFVFSMIFGHAPAMIERVLSFKGRIFHPVLYLWLVLLQLSLMTRVTGGIRGNDELVKWGGLINGIIIFLFLLTLATLGLIHKLKKDND